MHAPQTHLKGSFVLLFVDIYYINFACSQTAGCPLRAELCWRMNLCWRTWSLGERTPYLCKSDGCVCVHAVCNWQCILCALERHFHYSQVLCILSVDDRVSLDGRLLLRTGLRWSTQ